MKKKFRLWDEESKSFGYSDDQMYFTFSSDNLCETVALHETGYTVDDLEQFIGTFVQDKKDVYEGDILGTECLDGKDPSDGSFCDEWEMELLSDQPVHYSDEYLCFYGLPDIHEWNSVFHPRFVKVIGNIHETPELLNG